MRGCLSDDRAEEWLREAFFGSRWGEMMVLKVLQLLLDQENIT